MIYQAGSTLLACGSRSVQRYRMRRAMLRPLISKAMRSARAATLAARTRSRLPEGDVALNLRLKDGPESSASCVLLNLSGHALHVGQLPESRQPDG